jgi:E3 ubiquitin-protein ligase HERC3
LDAGSVSVPSIGKQPGQMPGPASDLGTNRTVKALSGKRQMCAIRDDDSLVCWGGNGSGEAGTGNTYDVGEFPGEMGDKLAAVDIGTNRTAKRIWTGVRNTFVQRDDETVVGFGYNEAGQLGRTGGGQGTLNRIIGDVRGEMGDNLQPLDVGTGRVVRDMTLSDGHTCAIVEDAAGRFSVFCWGQNDLGQLGLTVGREVPHVGLDPGTMGDALQETFVFVPTLAPSDSPTKAPTSSTPTSSMPSTSPTSRPTKTPTRFSRLPINFVEDCKPLNRLTFGLCNRMIREW